MVAVIAILFSGAQAFADMENGYGHRRGIHQGQDWQQRGLGGPGCGVADNLSAEEINQYINLCANFVRIKHIQARLDKLNKMLNNECSSSNNSNKTVRLKIRRWRTRSRSLK